MWGIVTGVKRKQTNEKAANYSMLLDDWEIDNSKIMTWINKSTVQSIDTKLAKYDTTHEVWE